MYKLLKRIDFKYVAMYVLSVILVGLLELITFGLSLERLLSPDFWSNLIIVLTAMILMFFTSANSGIKRIVSNDDNIKNKDQWLVDFGIEKGIDFDDYMAEINEERKREAYIKEVNRKIQKLKNKAKKKDLEIWGSNDVELKENNKYCQRMKSLLEQKTDEHISKNLVYIDIDYDFIKPSTIINDYTPRDQDREFEDGKKKKLRDNQGMFGYTIVYSVFISSFFLSPNTFDAVLIFNIVAKLMMLLNQYINGRSYSEKFVKEHTIVNLDKRITYAKGYWAWRKNRKEVTVNETTQLPYQP